MRYLTLVALCLQFAGCASRTHTLAEGQAIVDRAQTPAGQTRVAAECEQQPVSPEVNAINASMMGVPEAEAMAEFCRRFAAAIANGKLSPAQLVETLMSTQARRPRTPFCGRCSLATICRVDGVRDERLRYAIQPKQFDARRYSSDVDFRPVQQRALSVRRSAASVPILKPVVPHFRYTAVGTTGALVGLPLSYGGDAAKAFTDAC